MSNEVESLLKTKNIYYKHSGKDFLIKCLNPEHDDSNPSCRVDKVTGVTHCFSCGFKTNLFKFFGILSPISGILNHKLKTKINALRNINKGLELPTNSIPYNENYRGISSKTLKHFGAFYTDTVVELQDCIVFPLNDILGNTVGFIGRKTLQVDKKSRYVRWPANSGEFPTYPAILEEPNSSMIIVEGIFDFLNLYDKGIKNVVTTLGLGSLFKETNSKLLQYKAQGVTKIYIAYDADSAGIKAAKDLKPILETAGYITEIIDLPEGTDPGDLSKEDVTLLDKYVNSSNR